MANVLVLQATQMEDILGIPTSTDVFLEMSDTTTLANLQTWWNGYAPKLDAITGAQIIGADMKIFLTLPGTIKTSADALSEVERTGLFNFSQAGSRYKDGIDVPALKETVIVNGKIDLTNADITAWTTFITTVTAGITVVSKFANALQRLLDALISFRKHRKAENRRSFEVA